MATATQPHDIEERPEKLSKLPRARSILFGFALCLPVNYAVANAPQSSMFSMMVPPISALLVMILLNLILRKFVPRLSFSQSDLIVIYCIVSVAGVVGGEWTSLWHGTIYSLPFLSQTSTTFKDHILPAMPDSMVIKHLRNVQDITGGGKNWLYTLHKMPLYFPRFVAWGGISLALVLAFLCINSLMRKAWCERERLAFPLVQLPVSLSEDGGFGGMWRSKAMWIAFAIMFSIDILNGLNYLYPNLPSIPTKTLFHVDSLFKEPPWSNIGDFRISIYPFMAAIGLFMPNDLLFSFVFFYLMRLATHVILAANGIPQETFSGSGIDPGPPFFDEQTWGAALALFFGVVWVARGYLKELWQEIRFGRKARGDDISPRTAVVGLIIGFAVVAAYGVFYGHLSVPYMVLYVALFLMFSTALTRVVAQLGPPTHEFAYFGVNSFMYRFFGNSWLTDRQAGFLSTGFITMNRMYRNHPMPAQLEAMKMSGTERLNQKAMIALIFFAGVVGYFLACFFLTAHAYRTGGLAYIDAGTYMDRVLGNRHGPDLVGIIMTIFGFAVVLILDALRFQFPGFPLHPAGYFLSMNFGVDYYWFGLLIAFCIKNFVQRYYGLSGYDKLRAVALGILLGEYAAETIWMTMMLITHQSTYTISFNDRSLSMQ